MNYVFCPACFKSEDINNSIKIPLNCLMAHFQNYHFWKANENIKFFCVEEECRDCVKNEFRIANTYAHKKVISNFDVSFQSTELDQQSVLDTETSNVKEIDFLNNLSDYSDEDDNLKIDEIETLNPSSVDEWRIYFKKIIFEFLKNTSGTEAYIKDILLLLKKTLIPLQDESSINAKLALFSINMRDYIDEAKGFVETIKITDPEEVIINEDEVERDVVKRDKQLFYYIPFEKTIPLLMKRLEISETDSLNIILYGDDIQTNNSLGSHTRTGSFLHIAYKLHVPNNLDVIKKCSKLDNIMTLGVVLSEMTKFSKYDWLLAQIKKMLANLNIVHMKKKLSFKIFCFCGDHSFLQEVFNLPKSFKREGGSSCRTCMVEGRYFKNLRSCEEANNNKVLRGERFSSVMEYPLNEYSDPFHDILEGILANVIFCIVQKITYFDSQYRRLSSTAINWNPIEMEIRRFNKRDKCQNICSVLTDGFFSKYTYTDKIEKKNKFKLSGAEQLALGRSLYHCMTSPEHISFFENVDSEVFNTSKKLLCEILKIYYVINAKKEVNDREINFLESLINSFYKNYFKYVVEEARCSIKFHVLLHYPLYCRRYRNMTAVSCIRFESKNRIIKKLHSISNNKKNPSYTIMGKISFMHLVERELLNLA